MHLADVPSDAARFSWFSVFAVVSIMASSHTMMQTLVLDGVRWMTTRPLVGGNSAA